jgi:hypothetical protein
MPISKNEIFFKDIEIGKLSNKLKIFTGDLGPAVRVRGEKVSCRCYIDCPTAITGNQCGVLTQTCGVGRISSGEDVVTRQVSLRGILCKDTTMVLDYNFAASPDEVVFFAIFSDGSSSNLGSTGCVSGSGFFVFVIPAAAIAIKAVSTFACHGQNVNSSIDGFTISCA